MPGKLAILCPGQGAQHAAMFDFARRDVHANAWLDTLALPTHCGFEGVALDAITSDPARLFANRVAQPLIVGATLANWIAVKDRIPRPALVAGYSIGELSAHAVAGTLTAHGAIALAARRAQLMDDCARRGPPHALAAIAGIERTRLAPILANAGYFAAIDTPGSTIVGGLAPAMPALQRDVAAAGGSLSALPVGVASHTPLMAQAVAPFEALLRAHLLSPAPAIPALAALAVLAGISSERVTDADAAATTLSRQLSETIRWSDCLNALREAGITVALELGPGCGLSRMLRAEHPEIECRSVANFHGVDGVARWVSDRLE
jgi:[acyl-carrier-protein] S-malonyltransferase